MAFVPTSAAAPEALPLQRLGGLGTSPVPSRLLSLAIASALLMEFIDSTALSTALPTLARAFSTDLIELKLALTSYLLALALFGPASGWAADRFGARSVFTTAMALFLVGSTLCALARSLDALVAARVVQGMGGAMMTPVGRLIIVELSPRAKLVSAMAWFTTPALIGPIIGPPLAGFILEIGPWPWIFLINLPVGLAGMAAVGKLVPRIARPDPGPFDWRGFGLVSAGIIGLMAAAETVGLQGISSRLQIAGAAVAVTAFAGYCSYARGHARPVLDIGLLRYPTFRTSLVGGTIVRLGLGATPFLLPLLLQIGLGWSPSRAGLLMVATGVGALASRLAVTTTIRLLGFKWTLVASGMSAAVLTALPGFFERSTPVAIVLAALFATGFARAVQFTSTNALAYAEVPEAKVSAASTFATVVQQIGMSLGVTMGALALALAQQSPHKLTAEAFFLPFLLVGGISLLVAPIYLRLPASAGAELSLARPRSGEPHPHL